MAFVPSEFIYSGWEGVYFHGDATPWTWCFAGGLASLKGRPGVGQEKALLGEGGGSPDCGWVSRILPFFQQNVWFPYRLWGGILTTEALSRFRRDCSWQAVWLPSLCVGVCVHDFCDCPSVGETYTYDWQLTTHPQDYSGEMEGKHSQILKLSKVNVPPLTCRAG